MSVLRINISKLPEGSHQRSLQAKPDEIGLDARFTKEVQVEATLEKTTRQLFVRVGINTGGMFQCDRCLEDFETEVSTAYGVMYVTEEGAAATEEAEVQVISPEANMIDLGEDVRQYTILALPPKMLCGDDCAGLCPSCGTNLNKKTCQCQKEEVDSRWSGLQKLPKN